MADFAFNATVTHVLLDLEGNEIDGFEFDQGFRTELFGSCSTAFKGSMYVFGGFVQQRQVSLLLRLHSNVWNIPRLRVNR